MKTFELKLKNDGVTLTVYLPDASREIPRMAIKPGVLVIPGGGYGMCSDREAVFVISVCANIKIAVSLYRLLPSEFV